MQLSLTQARLRLIVALLLLCIALVAVLIVRAAAKDGQSPLTVMTRNLYLGADINRPLQSGAGPYRARCSARPRSREPPVARDCPAHELRRAQRVVGR